MKIKIFYILIIFCLLSNLINAQANLLNAKNPENIGKKTPEQIAANNDKPIPYGYVDDRDILWSKVVWEYMDLNEKINLPYYYPTDTANIDKDRRSLFDTLMDGIKAGEVTDVYEDSYFKDKLSIEEIEQRLVKVDTTDVGIEKLNAGEHVSEEDIDYTHISSADIEGYRIKGVWYFDKKQGELKYRLLGIAPVAPDVNFLNTDKAKDNLVDLFWVWFPQARNLLYKAKVFNQKNSAYPLSYDVLLNARRFNALIYKEENVYDNRSVSDYIKGNSLYQVLESQRIKEEIRNKELDMWSY